MSTEVRAGRAERRRVGKREWRRRYRRDVERINDLDRKGLATRTIAATVGLDEPLVGRILEEIEKHAEEKGYGA